MKQGEVIIVIPAYNPCEKLISLIRDLYSAEFKSIILVNDGSKSVYDTIFDNIKEEFESAENELVLLQLMQMGSIKCKMF